MKKEQMQSLLDTWYRDRDEAPRDADSGISRVMASVPKTPQRSRWWPFPVFYRRTQTPTATDTTKYQPSPIPATNGRTPTVIGRTQSMFSPVKAITAGAIVFAIGGAMFIAQPFNQQDSVPGAENGVAADIADPTGVTGSYGLAVDVTPGEITREGGVRMRHEEVSRGIPVEASDPRFSGEMTFTMSDRLYSPPAGAFWGEQTIENESGSWTGSVLGAGDPADRARAMGRYTGRGAYEGLWAVIFFDAHDRTFEGVILPGAPPPIE